MNNFEKEQKEKVMSVAVNVLEAVEKDHSSVCKETVEYALKVSHGEQDIGYDNRYQPMQVFLGNIIDQVHVLINKENDVALGKAQKHIEEHFLTLLEEWKQLEKDEGVKVQNLLSMYKGRSFYEQAGEAFEKKEYIQAHQLYMQGAEHGDYSCMAGLGKLYHMGLGVEQNYEHARNWYKQAMNEGSYTAYNNLGLMYEHEHGVEMNKEKAKELYKVAAEKGISQAMLNLGSLYYKQASKKDEKDYREAVEYLKDAVCHGQVTGLMTLGVIYSQEDWKEYSKERSIAYFKQAAEHGNLDAIYMVGMYYEEEGKKDPEYYGDAQMWYQKAIEQKDTEAMRYLARLYNEGKIDGKKNEQQMKLLYEKAAQLGDKYAMYHIGAVYMEEGKNNASMVTKGLFWLNKAAEQGEVRALKQLGDIYEQGLCGVQKNRIRSQELYRNALQQVVADIEKKT